MSDERSKVGEIGLLWLPPIPTLLTSVCLLSIGAIALHFQPDFSGFAILTSPSQRSASNPPEY